MAAFVAQIGVYNAFEAALQAGCQRVLFASSVHSMLGYPIDWGEGGKGEATDNKLVPNPVNTYGATKAWGEALCRKYSNADDLSCIAMRVRTHATTHSLPELACLRRVALLTPSHPFVVRSSPRRASTLRRRSR